MRFEVTTLALILALILLAPPLAEAQSTGSALNSPLWQLLATWGPMLVFIVIWIFFMRRYNTQYRQPWDQIPRHLEDIEKQLARIASILEDRRTK